MTTLLIINMYFTACNDGCFAVCCVDIRRSMRHIDSCCTSFIYYFYTETMSHNNSNIRSVGLLILLLDVSLRGHRAPSVRIEKTVQFSFNRQVTHGPAAVGP
jgi:hypothetical protein